MKDALERFSELEYKENLQNRNRTVMIYKICYDIDTNSWYQGFISFCIVFNTIILGTDTYPINF